MNLQQLRYIREVVRQNLSISLASDALHTSQSGVSRQIQLLEEELKLEIFQRNGKRLVCITEPGQIILHLAERVLRDLESIKRVCEDFTRTDTGSLSIATTHTQARYFLPEAVRHFMQEYPGVSLNIHQGNPVQVTAQVVSGEADIGIATEAIGTSEDLICIPCYQWNRCLVLPEDHPLLAQEPLTLAKIASYPMITYDFSVTGGSQVKATFERAGVEPNIVLTAIDADVIKTYVNLGLGVGLLASMAYDPDRDDNLKMIDVSALFPVSTTYLGVRRDAFLRDYVYDFISLLIPSLDGKAVRKLLKTGYAVN